MSTSCRRATASPQTFGRRVQRFVLRDAPRAVTRRWDDARLFAMTFVGGFLFTAVYLA
jgi:hypothetical protein